MNRSHLTAISRKKQSRPLRMLIERDLIKGRILDYGSGKGFDAQSIQAEQWDPHYQPARPRGRFDTIICFYVLNVVDVIDEHSILEDIRGLLHPGGTAYIAVRRDLKREGKTSRGTFQRTVHLDLPLLCEDSALAIYTLRATYGDALRTVPPLLAQPGVGSVP